MELSGLIFVALALVWAVVLIPKALRHHDEVARTRSVDQVSDAGRVLARREVVSEREARLVVPARASLAPHGANGWQVDPAAVAEQASPAAPAVTRPRAHRASARAAARRRRHILASLLLATLGVVGGVVLGYLLPWAPGIPVAVTICYLTLARITVRRERARWDRDLQVMRSAWERADETELLDADPASDAQESLENEPQPLDVVQVKEVRNHQGLAVVTGLDDTASIPVSMLAGLQPTTEAGALWDPLPVTLPTYVTKPRATRSVRTIDLSEPDVSSSGRDAADSALVAEAATAVAASEGANHRAVGS